MYKRLFGEPPKKIVENGKAHFGTYSSVSQHLDIKGMRAPYAGVPVPSFLSNIRIKSRITYTFNLGNYVGLTEFRDFKVFGLVEVIFWNKETGKKNSYHAIMPARRRFVPTKTTNAICGCYQRKRRIKLYWEDTHDFFKCRFKIKGDKVRPSAKGKMISMRNDSLHTDTMFVNPAPTSSRVSATWISSMKIKGYLRTYTEKKDPGNKVRRTDGIALVSMNRSYYKFHTRSKIVTGLGQVKDRNILFHISTANIDAADADKYNNNLLIIDGDTTALPPVVITHPFGVNNNWIIQDTEGMIDLTFTPVSVQSRVTNLIIMRASAYTIYGTYEGVLLTKDGEKINLKNFPGIVSSNIVRT
ncbi:MAG: DUF2804 domain-containing protein [Treponema sp.]|nr:DUF2804 domain-containing protein [Treponema sp.]